MSLLWRQIGGVNSRSNREDGIAQLDQGNGSRSVSKQRIKVVRPQKFTINSQDTFSHYAPPHASQNSNPPRDLGFWMTPNSHLSGSYKSRSSSPTQDNHNAYDSNRSTTDYHANYDDHHNQQITMKTDSNRDNEPDQRKMTVVEEFCQETGFDGLKHAGNSALPMIARLIWLVIVIGAATGLGYQFVKSTLKYSSFPVNTQISVTNERYLIFPSVTLCNINLFRTDKLTRLYGGSVQLYDRGLPQLRQLFPQLGVGYEPMNVPLDETYPGNVTLREFIQINSHRLEDMLVKCTFDGETCSADDFILVVTNYGVCYSYNSDMNNVHSVNKAGQRRGLSLILNAQYKLYVAAPRESVGFKILAHDIGEFPNMDDRGKELQPGTHVAFGIERTEFTKQPWPYGACEAEAGYTQNKCYLDCETKYVVDQCHCRTYYMKGDAPYCSPYQLVECVYETIDYFNENRDEPEFCNHCEEACKQTVYKASLSQSTFPSYAIPSVLEANKNWQYAALGFGELVSLTAFPKLDEVLNDELTTLYDAIAALQNSQGITFLEFTSPEVVNETYVIMVEKIFRNVPYDIYDTMGDRLFYDFYPYLEEKDREYIGPESTYYWAQEESAFENYVTTGILWYSLKYGLSVGNSGLVDDTYVQYVYEQFGFEDLFFDAFNITFNGVYSIMKNVSEEEVLRSLDLTTVTTDYMRANLLHVDIFYEELKLTKIEDQVGYEFFQYLCDIGGALGLFFGASLLSFIEIFAFCSTRCGRSR